MEAKGIGLSRTVSVRASVGWAQETWMDRSFQDWFARQGPCRLKMAGAKVSQDVPKQIGADHHLYRLGSLTMNMLAASTR